MREFFESVAVRHHLGQLLSEPQILHGGFLHKMVALRTESGDFAAKLLNPSVMARPEALGNFRQANAWETLLESHPIPILPALALDGQKLQQLSGQYYYLFPFFCGKALTVDSVTPEHCRIIASHLAQLHRVPCPGIEFTPDPAPAIDWEDLPARLLPSQPQLAHSLQPLLPLLSDLQERAASALPKLPRTVSLCHNDMDPKNVLWNGWDCRIIDLECLAPAFPALELFDLCLVWSGADSQAFDPARLRAFLASYQSSGGILPKDWDTLWYARTAPLFWLEYSLRRAVGEEGAESVRLGTEQSFLTLSQIQTLQANRSRILSLLETFG